MEKRRERLLGRLQNFREQIHDQSSSLTTLFLSLLHHANECERHVTILSRCECECIARVIPFIQSVSQRDRQTDERKQKTPSHFRLTHSMLPHLRESDSLSHCAEGIVRRGRTMKGCSMTVSKSSLLKKILCFCRKTNSLHYKTAIVRRHFELLTSHFSTLRMHMSISRSQNY